MKARHSYGIPADFEYSVIDDVLVITDLDMGGKSVTNDAESVLETIRENYENAGGFSVMPEHIIYRDSDGIYDGMTPGFDSKGNVALVKFYPIRSDDLKRAVREAKGVKYYE